MIFDVNASGHPFLLKTTQTTGTSDQVQYPLAPGQTVQVGSLTWSPNQRTPSTTTGGDGTFITFHQHHSGMQGTVIVQPSNRTNPQLMLVH